MALFAHARTTKREYDTPTNVNGTLFNRDAEGYDVQAGLDFESAALLRGRFSVGYLEENREDDQFEDVDGLALDGTVQWFPSQIVTVTANASRRVEDQGVIQAPSAVSENFGVKVDYEFRRNIILSAGLETQKLDFDEIDRSDDFTWFALGATYKANRNLHIEALARAFDRDSSSTTSSVGQQFDKSAFTIGLKYYP